MKLLYVIKRPLSPRDAERYGVKAALEMGHKVQVLDVSHPTHPMLSADQEGVWTHPGLSITVIRRWSELNAQARLLSDADLIMLFNQSYGLSRATLPVLRAIARAKTPYLIMAPVLYGAVAANARSARGAGGLSDLVKRLRDADPINSLIARLKPGWLGIPAARFVVYNGLASLSGNSLVDGTTEAIYSHSPDYEQAKDLAASQSEDMAVFLDQFIPYHPDTQALQLKNTIDPDNYYRCIRTILDRVERELGLRVVIALHPRADYSNRQGIMGEREMVAGRSAELIARSKLVITHVSTAMGMVVMFKKPILLVVTRDHYDLTPSHGPVFEQVAETMNIKLHVIDRPEKVDLSAALRMDEDRYTHYVDHYLRHPMAVPGQSLWQAVFGTASRSLGVT